MNDGDYQEWLRDDCQQVARRYDFPLRVASADNDAYTQVQQIRACLEETQAERPTAILVSPVREAALLPMASIAARLGIGWVMLGRWNRYMADLREEFARLPIFAVMADQREIGRIQGKQVRAILARGGELVYIHGPLAAMSASLRFEGLQESLEGSRIRIQALPSDWTMAGGTQAIRDWLGHGRRRAFRNLAVGAQNDAMAMGARNALTEAAGARSDVSLQQVGVTGCDGSPKYGRCLVSKGLLRATVIMPPTAGRAISEIATFRTYDERPHAEIVLPPLSFPDLSVLAGAFGRQASTPK